MGKLLLLSVLVGLYPSILTCQTPSSVPEIHFRQGVRGPIQCMGFTHYPEPSVVTVSGLRGINYFSADHLQEYRNFYSSHIDLKFYAKLLITDTILVAADSGTGVLKIINITNDELMDSIPGMNLKGNLYFSSDLRSLFTYEDERIKWFNTRTKKTLYFELPASFRGGSCSSVDYYPSLGRIAVTTENAGHSILTVFDESRKVLCIHRFQHRTIVKMTEQGQAIAVERDGLITRLTPTTTDIQGNIEKFGTLADQRIKESVISTDGRYIFMHFNGVNGLKKIIVYDINRRCVTDTIPVSDFNYLYEPSYRQFFFQHKAELINFKNKDNSNPYYLGSYNFLTKSIFTNTTSTFSAVIGFDYSPESKALALLNDHLEIKIYDLASNRVLTPRYAKDTLDFERGSYANSNQLFYSAHGGYLIKFSNYRLTVWNAKINAYLTSNSTKLNYGRGVYPSDEDSIVYLFSYYGFGRFNLAKFQEGVFTKLPFANPFEWSVKVVNQDFLLFIKTIAYNQANQEVKPKDGYYTEPLATVADSVYVYSLKKGYLLKKILTATTDAHATAYKRYSFDRLAYDLVINDPHSTERIHLTDFRRTYQTGLNNTMEYSYRLRNGNILTTRGLRNVHTNTYRSFRTPLDYRAKPLRMDDYNPTIDFDSLHFFSIGRDGSFKIMNMETGEEELSAVSFDSPNPVYADNWLYVTAAGFFDGTASVLDQFYWQDAGGTRYDYDKFYETFFTPNLIFHILKHDLENKLDLAYFTKIPGLQQLLDSHHAHYANDQKGDYLCIPNIEADNPIAHLPFEPNIEINQRDAACKIKIRIPAKEAHDLADKASPAKFNLDTLYYFNNHRKGNLFFIPFTIGNYPRASTLRKLPSSEVSERNFFTIFDSLYQPFKAEFDTVFYDAPRPDSVKTLGEIYKTLNAYIDSIKEEDFVIFYFSGHGVIPYGSQMFYFIPFDGIATDVHSLKQTALPAATIADFPNLVHANRVLIILDACQSGGTLNCFAKAGVEKSLNNPHASTAIIASSSPLEFTAQNKSGSELSYIIPLIIRQAINEKKSLTLKELINKVNTFTRNNTLIQTHLGIVAGTDFPLFSF